MQNQAYNINTPLPPGWEARWVPEQNRYFYINHQQKTTQWEDPRFHIRPTPQAAAAESSYSENVDQALLEKLHQDFPNASKALIADMLVGCFNNERETREQLADIGFVKERKSPQRKTSTKRNGDVPKELSQAEKNRVFNQMASMFPNVQKVVIETSLKVVNYDVEKGKELIKAFTDEQNENAKRRQINDSSSRGESASSSSSASSNTSPNLLPEGLTYEAENRPQAFSTSSTSTTQRARPRAAQPQQYNTTITLTSEKSRTTPKKQSKVVTAQPHHKKRTNNVQDQGNVLNASLKVKALGPDPSLQSGPDASLLSTDRMKAQGPDTSLRNGPDRSFSFGPNSTFVLGSMGASGSDSSLRCGPQASLLGKENSPLVTSI